MSTNATAVDSATMSSPAFEGPPAAEASRFPMRTALLRLTCFFALIAVLACSANAIIGLGLRRLTTTHYGSWNAVMQGKVNADIVISGSSRAAYHYDPRIIEAVTGHRAFNLGRNGSQTDIQLAVLNAYLEHNRKPLVVIHNLDAFSFVPTTEIYDPALYVPYLSDPELYRSLTAIDPNLRKSRYIPLYGYVVEDMNFSWMLGLRSLLGVPPSERSFAGFTPQNRAWTDDFDSYRKMHPDGVSFPVEHSGVDDLTQLIRTCEDNRIPLIFVYSPEYSEMQHMTNNRREIFAEFQKLSTTYQVPVWDFSNWKYDDDRAYFYNSQHLNATGAELFSKDLAARLSAWLARQQLTSPELSASGALTGHPQ